MKRNTFIFVVALVIQMVPLAAFAYMNENSLDELHLLSTSGGIANPSSYSAFEENPAGLIFNNQVKLQAAVASEGTNFSPLGFSGDVYLGNGTVGGVVGLRNYSAYNGNTNTPTLLDFGLAADWDQLNIAIGAAGQYLLNGSGANAWGVNAGMLYNPHGKLRVGATLFSVVGGVQAIGAGVAGDISSNAILAVDYSVTPQGNGSTVKPGLTIHTNDVALTYSYGISIDTINSSWLRRGNTVGIGINASQKVSLEGYYNELALYYVGLSIKL